MTKVAELCTDLALLIETSGMSKEDKGVVVATLAVGVVMFNDIDPATFLAHFEGGLSKHSYNYAEKDGLRQKLANARAALAKYNIVKEGMN